MLWSVSVETEYQQDPDLSRTPSSLVLSLDRITFSSYGSIDTRSELATQTSMLLLWLVCHSRRHRKRLERMHSTKQLIEAPSAALASDRCDGVCRAALFAIQWLACRQPKTKAPLAQKCAKGLSRLVQMERSASFRKEALHCLLNLSTGGKDATTVLAEHNLAALVDVATAPDESDVDVKRGNSPCPLSRTYRGRARPVPGLLSKVGRGIRSSCSKTTRFRRTGKHARASAAHQTKLDEEV